nr:Probable siderophore transport system permease protein yfiZ precursor [Klebsiella pneumoniae]
MGNGQSGPAEWPTLLVAATLIIPAALAVWWMASRLNLLQLGDEEAHYLGVNVQALQRWLLLCSAVLVAVAVAISGVIGFIGPVVPHLMRLWLGPDHRGLIPGSLLAGAILLLLADTLARTVAAPAEIPVGLLTSLLGAPGFCGWSFVGELQTWLMNTAPRGCHFTLVNDRLSTTSPSRCAAAR